MRHTSSHIVSLALTALNRVILALADRESAAELEKKKSFDFTTDTKNPCRTNIDKLNAYNDLCASQATSD